MTPILVIATSLITAIFGPIIVEWIKLKFLHKRQIDVLGESIDNDEKIDRQLEILLDGAECNCPNSLPRVTILEVSNAQQ